MYGGSYSGATGLRSSALQQQVPKQKAEGPSSLNFFSHTREELQERNRRCGNISNVLFVPCSAHGFTRWHCFPPHSLAVRRSACVPGTGFQDMQ